MWVFLNNAFVSAVQDPKKREGLVVRARLRGDLQRVFPKARVIETPGRDYRYRCFVSKDAFANAMARAARGITYGNFKSSVKDNARHDAYLGVWGVMHRAQVDQLNPKPKFDANQRGFPFQAPDYGHDDGFTEDWDGPVHRRPLG